MDTKCVSISHDDAVLESLRRDSDLAAEYLRAAVEENVREPEVLMMAVRRVVQVYGYGE